MKRPKKISPFDLTSEQARALWVEDLKSGKYMQGKRSLHRIEDDTYCCLGVACCTFLRCGGKLKMRKMPPGIMAYDWTATVLPEVVRRWLGLASPGGRYKRRDDRYGVSVRCLVNDNDGGKPFSEIASIIESGEIETEERERGSVT